MKEIRLTRGKVALVDDEDYERLSGFKWQALKSRRDYYYAGRHVPLQDSDGHKQRMMLMHRVILESPPGQAIDHRNGDGLDNRRCNLRFCTTAENQANRCKHDPDRYASMFKGVTWRKDRRKWRAQIKVNGKDIALGSFHSEVVAAFAYNVAARAAWGEFALLNEIPGW